MSLRWGHAADFFGFGEKKKEKKIEIYTFSSTLLFSVFAMGFSGLLFTWKVNMGEFRCILYSLDEYIMYKILYQYTSHLLLNGTCTQSLMVYGCESILSFIISMFTKYSSLDNPRMPDAFSNFRLSSSQMPLRNQSASSSSVCHNGCAFRKQPPIILRCQRLILRSC